MTNDRDQSITYTKGTELVVLKAYTTVNPPDIFVPREAIVIFLKDHGDGWLMVSFSPESVAGEKATGRGQKKIWMPKTYLRENSYDAVRSMVKNKQQQPKISVTMPRNFNYSNGTSSSTTPNPKPTRNSLLTNSDSENDELPPKAKPRTIHLVPKGNTNYNTYNNNDLSTTPTTPSTQPPKLPTIGKYESKRIKETEVQQDNSLDDSSFYDKVHEVFQDNVNIHDDDDDDIDDNNGTSILVPSLNNSSNLLLGNSHLQVRNSPILSSGSRVKNNQSMSYEDDANNRRNSSMGSHLAANGQSEEELQIYDDGIEKQKTEQISQPSYYGKITVSRPLTASSKNNIDQANISQSNLLDDGPGANNNHNTFLDAEKLTTTLHWKSILLPSKQPISINNTTTKKNKKDREENISGPVIGKKPNNAKWKQNFVSLQLRRSEANVCKQLVFYKNEDDFSASPPKPSISFILRKCTVSRYLGAKEYKLKDFKTKKKNVLIINRVDDGAKIALYFENDDKLMNFWSEKLEESCKLNAPTKEEVYGTIVKPKVAPTTHNTKDQRERASDSKNFDIDSEKTPPTNPFTSALNSLRGFFTSNPEALSNRNKRQYCKDRFFGIDLSDDNQYKENYVYVEKFVKNVICQIENFKNLHPDCEGIEREGMYRINAAKSKLQELRFFLDEHYRNENKYIEKLQKIDVVDNLGGLLKYFLREFKTQLIPADAVFKYHEFHEKNDDQNHENTSHQKNCQWVYKEIFNSLPEYSRKLLKILLPHLIKVISVSKNMDVSNMAKCFTPTICDCTSASDIAMLPLISIYGMDLLKVLFTEEFFRLVDRK